jgi:hypothetical protein
VRVKKAKQRRRSTRVKNSAGARRSRPSPWAISKRAVVLAVICVMAAVPLITARQRYYLADFAGVDVDAAPETIAQPEEMSIPAPPPARRATTKIVGAEPALESMKALAQEPTVDTPAAESAPKETAVESAAKADVADVAPVTITGCLERDEHTFRLKDTSGVDVPKSRSWRSGFFKKSTLTIELVDATYSLNLAAYVGQRVAATGVLVNRALRARSLQPVAASCN